LQQAICALGVDVAPSTQVAHSDQPSVAATAMATRRTAPVRVPICFLIVMPQAVTVKSSYNDPPITDDLAKIPSIGEFAKHRLTVTSPIRDRRQAISATPSTIRVRVVGREMPKVTAHESIARR